MGAALLTVRPQRWPRWRDLDEVERVGVYTRQSLYALLWGFIGVILVSAAARVGAAEAVALVAGGIVVTAAGFAVMLATMRGHPAVRPPAWRRLAPLLVLGGAFYAVGLAAWDGDARAAATMVVVVNLTLPLGLVPDPRLSGALVLAAGALFGVAGGEVRNVVAGLVVGAAFVFSARASMWLFGIVTELDTARRAQAQLAVAEERLRFSRDVHDVLGRRLSTIAVQAELAATLAGRGDERGPERMLEVRETAHEALREARELARGYRSTDFPQELEGARSLLRSAGIDVREQADGIPRAWQEAAGWIVREAVTNVLRHSSATVVEIAYADGRLTVANDGPRPAADGVDGSGLRGLRERLAPLGAALDAGPDGDRWTLVARLPGSGPLSATTDPQAGR